MDKLLFLAVVLPFTSHAEIIADHNVNFINGKYYAVPTSFEYRLVDPRGRGIHCDRGLNLLKNSVQNFQEKKCDLSRPSDDCKALIKEVTSFAAVGSFGLVKTPFRIEYVDSDANQAKTQIAGYFNVSSDKVEILEVKKDSFNAYDWEVAGRDENEFYSKIMKVYGYEESIEIEFPGTQISTPNRLEFCAIHAKEITFKAEREFAHRIDVPVSQKETPKFYDIYQKVKFDWAQFETKRNWKNSLHQFVYAGLIVKRHIPKASSSLDFKIHFNKYFSYIFREDYYDLKIQKYKNLEDFTNRTNSPKLEYIVTTIQLKHQD